MVGPSPHIYPQKNYLYNYILHLRHYTYCQQTPPDDRHSLKKSKKQNILSHLQLEYFCVPSHVGKLQYPAAHWSHLSPITFSLQVHIPVPSSHNKPFDPSSLQLQAEILIMNF